MSQKRIKSKALQMAQLRFLVAENERLKCKAASLENQLRAARQLKSELSAREP